MTTEYSPYHVKFQIDGLPKSTNQIARKHWAVQAKERRDWHRKVFLAVAPNFPNKPLKKAKLHLTRHSSKCPDWDGMVSSWKAVIDGLVKSRVLEDDSMNHIGQPTYEWSKTKPKQGFITVEVWEEHE